jgi:hypothetical protein
MDLRNHILRVWSVLTLLEVGTNVSLSSALYFFEKGSTFLKLLSDN